MSGRPKVVLFGARGQVGRETRSLLEHHGYPLTPVGRDKCDLSSLDSVRSLIFAESPQVIINAAAFTAVDRAESEPALAMALNADAPAVMAKAAREIGGLFIHFSSDYVFDGSGKTPRREEDPTGPLNVYGRSKLEGERAILAVGGASFVFRTSWVFASHGTNFVRTMLRLGESRKELAVVSDQSGAPTWAGSLAELSLHVVRMFSSQSGVEIAFDEAAELAGIYHATSSGSTTWHGFACAIFDEARARGFPLIVDQMRAISSDEYPVAAKRPLYSLLSNAKLNDNLGFTLPPWRESLIRVMNEIEEKRLQQERSAV